VRLLFSAHGLPEKIVKAGDPYQAQVEAVATAVAERLGAANGCDDLDWMVCYQSRVGRLKWLGPSTTEAIEAAALEGKGVIVCPISFVSEHIETLVELDHDYAVLAAEQNVEPYIRVAALGVHRFEIELRGDLDAHLGHRAVSRGVEIFRRVEHRLRRNAADVEAGPAQRLAAFGAGGLEAKLRSADGSDITAGAGTNYENVIVEVGHHSSLRA